MTLRGGLPVPAAALIVDGEVEVFQIPNIRFEISTWFGILVTLLDIVVSLIASGHVLLTKRNPRSAVSWIGLIWLSPIIGTVLYVMLGINRINRRGRSLQQRRKLKVQNFAEMAEPVEPRSAKTPEDWQLRSLEHLGGSVTNLPLLQGNQIEPLESGDETYPAMLAAIEGASRTVSLCSYLFNNDDAGKQFVGALQRAVDRGVEVRVLVDDVGARYNWPTILKVLKSTDIKHAAFLPTSTPLRLPFFNLRNHRKIMVVDGSIAFTGGMNILADYQESLDPPKLKRDLHFRVQGPIVKTLQRVFADDWSFTTGEILRGEGWFPRLEKEGSVFSRAVMDGPDNDTDPLQNMILGGLGEARRSVLLVTPYFLPDEALISALQVTAMRGVEVDILLPSQNNLAFVKWASTSLIEQVLEGGCRVWWTSPPFDHTKLMVVDGSWTFLGSANLDPRSLRLNFELNLECYCPELASKLLKILSAHKQSAEAVTLDSIRQRSLPAKLRDGAAGLFFPYL
ncbi:phospholipase D-like domain-containing protein [Isosphaeraceae bacterium EP7]